MNLVPSKIDLQGRKAVCIDDLIVTPRERKNFLYHSRLKQEDVFFTGAYEPALDLIDNHPEIGLAIIDLRIPHKSEDSDDFNAENPDREWGSEIVAEISQKYPQRRIDCFVISAYRECDISDFGEKSLVRAFYKKPVDYDSLIRELVSLINSDWKKTFSYDFLDRELSIFIREKTQEIKFLARRTSQDIVNIGNYLIEIKNRLGHGNYYNWFKAEFPNWNTRSASKFMDVARKFKSVDLSDIEILPSTLYALAVSTTPEEAIKEVIDLAKKGESVNLKTTKEIIDKHKSPARKNTQNTQLLASEQVLAGEEVPSSSNQLPKEQTVKEQISSDRIEKAPALQESLSSKKNELLPQESLSSKKAFQPKPEIIGVRHNVVKNSFWQLGKDHKLFCGEPRETLFLEQLPSKVALTINLPPNNDLSLVPQIISDSEFSLRSKFRNEFPLDLVTKMIKNCFSLTTDSQDNVVFSYLFDLELLEIAIAFGCYCYVAEPDLSKCEQILSYWRQKSSVLRLAI